MPSLPTCERFNTSPRTPRFPPFNPPPLWRAFLKFEFAICYELAQIASCAIDAPQAVCNLGVYKLLFRPILKQSETWVVEPGFRSVIFPTWLWIATLLIVRPIEYTKSSSVSHAWIRLACWIENLSFFLLLLSFFDCLVEWKKNNRRILLWKGAYSTA